MAASDESVGLDELNGLVRTTLEGVAKFMGADRGRWRLEIEFEDGQLHRMFRHHGPIGGNSLAASMRDTREVPQTDRE